MLFFPSKLFRCKELQLSNLPNQFAQELIAWGTDEAHKDASLILDRDVLKFMKRWSLSYYKDSCLVVVLRECVVIGSYMFFDGRNVVVLNELLLTYPEHKILYNRVSGKLSPILGLFIAHLKKEEE